jgi:hypothetical protein
MSSKKHLTTVILVPLMIILHPFSFRDYCDKLKIEVLPFTYDLAQFKRGLASVRATGGGDAPDVFSAVEVALAQNWMSRARAIIHIAGSP